MTNAVDSFGRIHRSLRVSVTDRCNLRCRYCMPPEGTSCDDREQLLDFEEVVFAVEVAVSLGIDRIRLTGGEPLVRGQLHRLVGMLKRETDVAEVAMTTNGLLLERYADQLAEAGLDRVNVSVDSLRADRFEAITRHGMLEAVWAGIETAADAGLTPLRINALLLEGINDDEVEDWLALTEQHPVDVRFMELMPIGEGAEMYPDRYVDVADLRDRLVDREGLVSADPDVGNGPARYWRIPGAPGRIGFITPLSDPYCNSCSRMRLTSKGELRACLAYDEQVDIRPAIRAGDRREVREGFLRALEEKPAGHRWRDGDVTEGQMSAVGG